MSNSQHKKYAYRVVWSPDYDCYVGLCAEIPRVSCMAETQSEALSGVIEMVRDTVDSMLHDGEIAPEPISLKEYTGDITIKTTPQVHRRLAIEAAERGISLNRLINDKIS